MDDEAFEALMARARADEQDRNLTAKLVAAYQRAGEVPREQARLGEAELAAQVIFLDLDGRRR